jgi:hypothetical protein
VVSLGGTAVLYLFRTENGLASECLSHDDGRSWAPKLVSYASNGVHLKQPRGPLTLRRLADGSFLLLYFNNGWRGYSGPSNATRDPYFLALGRLTTAGDDIEWSQPEVVLYGRGFVSSSPVAASVSSLPALAAALSACAHFQPLPTHFPPVPTSSPCQRTFPHVVHDAECGT